MSEQEKVFSCYWDPEQFNVDTGEEHQLVGEDFFVEMNGYDSYDIVQITNMTVGTAHKIRDAEGHIVTRVK